MTMFATSVSGTDWSHNRRSSRLLCGSFACSPTCPFRGIDVRLRGAAMETSLLGPSRRRFAPVAVLVRWKGPGRGRRRSAARYRATLRSESHGHAVERGSVLGETAGAAVLNVLAAQGAERWGTRALPLP